MGGTHECGDYEIFDVPCIHEPYRLIRHEF